MTLFPFSEYWWLYAAFLVFVLAMLALDLGVFHRKAKEVKFKEGEEVQQGEILTWHGRAEEGIGWVQKAMRLNPYHPERFWSHLARAYFLAGRYGEAVEALHRISTPDVNQRALLVASLAQLEHEDAARAQAATLLDSDPAFRISAHVAGLYFKQETDRAHYGDALRKAGLPE